MSRFNPNAPDTLGPEIRPTIEASTVLTSPLRAASMTFTAAVSETVLKAAVYLPTVYDFATWELEIFNVANLGDLVTTVTACMPSIDVRARNAFAQFDDATGQHPADLVLPSTNGIWQAIDGYPDPLFRGKGSFWNSGVELDDDELIYPNFGNAMEYAARFNGVSAVAGTARVVSVKVQCYAQQYIDLVLVSGMSITPFLLINGVRHLGDKVVVPDTEGGFLVGGFWPINPATGCSWVAPDLDQFDATATGKSGAGWLVDATGSSNNLSTILQGWMEIEVTNDLIDPRIAKGCLTPTVPGWWTFDLEEPSSGDPGFVKTATHNYVATLRRRHENGKIGWRYLAGDVAASTMQGVETTYTVEKQLLRSIDDPTERTFALVFTDGAGYVSADSQPYASIDGDRQLDLGIDLDWPPVRSGRVLEQEITTVGAGDYGWVRAMVRLESGTADAPLTIRLVNAANAQQGFTFTVQPEDLIRPRTNYQMVEGPVGATLLAATQYRVLFESTATAGAGWRVQTLSTFTEGSTARTPVGASAVTWGGIANAAVIAGDRFTELDLVTTIATQPSPPAGFIATVTEGDHACDQFATLSWTATDVEADAGFFLRYEIDRSEGEGWHRVAEITSESVVGVEDHEAKRNIESYYRIRVRRTDWSCSYWSENSSAEPLMSCCGYILTSNAAPELTLWADDIGPDRSTQPLQTTQVNRYYGRDHSVGHHSLEWSGVRFQRTLVIAADGVSAGNETPASGGAGEEIYNPLTALLPSRGAALPYITLLSNRGERWFVSMDLGSWQHQGFGDVYTADVGFTTVTDVPSPIDMVP